jgi:hypothetical protein
MADCALSTFTYRQIPVNPIEFRAVPGPKTRAFGEKTMRHESFPRSGGQPKFGM